MYRQESLRRSPAPLHHSSELNGSAARFIAWSDTVRPQVDIALATHLDSLSAHVVAKHSPLVAAMRHGVMNGGKRVRALAVLAAAQCCCQVSAAPEAAAMQVACAVEYIHAYSLIHDDLPCMDDDDLRRGQPTVHIVYGEDMALLAGDALQTLAFEVLSGEHLSEIGLPVSQQLQLIRTLARAAGTVGMAGGQAIDCHHVGQTMGGALMRQMHELKTGALLHASVMLGAHCGAAALNADELASLSAFADTLGLLFQVVDDILDASQDTATLGKTAGKDEQANKPTYVQALGLDGARAQAQTLYAQAIAELAPWGERAQPLIDLAAYCHERIH